MMRSTGSRIRTTKGLFLSLLLLSSSCSRVSQDIEPKVNYAVHEKYLKQLPTPFPSLTAEERSSDWGKEYLIGVGFARKLDLYRAITAFRRAELLTPIEATERRLEIEYEILLCYYLGRRYSEVETAFNGSDLAKVGTDFPAFQDLLVILYDTYDQLDDWTRACQILELIYKHYPASYETLSLSSAMQRADFEALHQFTELDTERPYLCSFLTTYENRRKSPATAGFLNAVIPGSGYLYLGQNRTALTAFLVNGLFIAASVHFFKNGPVTAGIITASFEAGWYFGGIQGGASQARLYNQCLYEEMATPMMNREKLFPVFMINYGF